MVYSQKLKLFKKIILIGLFFSVIPLTVILLILGDIAVIYSIFNDCIIPGKSIFFPFLPSYNIFWFLPKEAQIIQLCTGHLIDILIFSNIISLVEIAGYQYYKKMCLNENFLSPIMVEYNQETYEISQDQYIFFGLNKGFDISFKNKPSNNKYESIQSYSQRLNNGFIQYKKQYNKSDFIQNSLILHKLSTKLKKLFEFFHSHSILEKINDNISYHHIFYPLIKANVKNTNSFQYRGKNIYYIAYNFKKSNQLNTKLNLIKKIFNYNKIRQKKNGLA